MLMFLLIFPMSSLELMSFLALLMIFLGPDSESRNIKTNAVKSLVDVMRIFEKATSEMIEQKMDSITKKK